MASTASDFDLAAGAASGDEAAFGELYERYFDRLYDFALRTVGDRDAAADVVQSTFVKAWDMLRKGAAPDHVKAWLFTVARNAAIDELRRAKRSSSLDTVAQGDSDDGTSGLPAFAELDQARAINPEVANVDREMAELVWAAARGLNAKEYTLLDMHVRQELSIEEIAWLEEVFEQRNSAVHLEWVGRPTGELLDRSARLTQAVGKARRLVEALRALEASMSTVAHASAIRRVFYLPGTGTSLG